MRLLAITLAALALAGPAAAATPRFAVYDLQHDLAAASKNDFGDVAVKPRAQLAGKGTLVRCGTWCRFGAGWLAFRSRTVLAPGDASSAKTRWSKKAGWTVHVTLSAAGRRSWTAYGRAAKSADRKNGVPDVLVVVAGGQVAAAPLTTQVHATSGVLVLTGFSRASAKALAAALG
jgi:hypothetical protein